MYCEFNHDGPPWRCEMCGFTHPGQRRPRVNCRADRPKPQGDSWARYYDFCMVCGELAYCELAKCRKKLKTKPCPQGNW